MAETDSLPNDAGRKAHNRRLAAIFVMKPRGATAAPLCSLSISAVYIGDLCVALDAAWNTDGLKLFHPRRKNGNCIKHLRGWQAYANTVAPYDGKLQRESTLYIERPSVVEDVRQCLPGFSNILMDVLQHARTW
jgi:hypothetical protein